jgi:hypothetical protein
MGINIQLKVIEGDAEVKMEIEKVGIADLQAALSNLELLKFNLLGQLASMTEINKKIQKIGDDEGDN